MRKLPRTAPEYSMPSRKGIRSKLRKEREIRKGKLSSYEISELTKNRKLSRTGKELAFRRTLSKIPLRKPVSRIGRLLQYIRFFRAQIGSSLVHQIQLDNAISAEKFGLPFLQSFPRFSIRGIKRKRFSVSVSTCDFDYESPVSITLHLQDMSKAPNKKTMKKEAQLLSEARLGFEKDSVKVEALQINSILEDKIPEIRQWLDRFKSKTGKPWANFLVQKIEDQARKLGLKQVKITIPERLYYYQNPFVKPGQTVKKIRKGMRELYYGVANAMDYRIEGDYFVKDL